ncbi:BppU family phage baseplate upper protein [Staphylococcus xylosus]|uniref:BppU family phage baseplate upper protein n=1 Tax=Staphylococcus xylosus TaxID=1288 RepID=UPI001CDBDA8B|nr:BppU family phage baseplate upper protein [Staphylococcus xylosus]UBV35735.1 BppU family phage baseplate upper protein [Staphylococcus xylosus]
MVSNLEKSSIVNMENTARYQTRSKLNVAFSTADRDSAVFVFNVTKGNKPLLLSSENVTGHIALKHNDGSFVKDTLHFTEPNIDGRFEYSIPNDMLKRQGTVTMQIFISEKGNSNVTVAERIVTFDIEESIVSQISAETKLQYIVEYDELQAVITNRIIDIEEKIENAEDYVSQLEQAREKGLTDIEIAKSDSIKTLNDLADKRIEEINNKASEYSSKFDDDKQYMDEKHESFKQSVLDSEVVTQGESKDWQKYKLTREDGTYTFLNLENDTESFYNLSNGIYFTVNTPHGIDEVSRSGFTEMKVRQGSNTKRLSYRPYNSNRIFEKWFYEEWSNWKEILTLSTDEELETYNSANSRANETLTEANLYTDNQINNQQTVLFDGSANGVGTEISLTDDYTDYSVIFISGSYPGGEFTKTHLIANSRSININKTNLIDDGADGGAFYELLLRKTDEKTLTIALDNYMEITSNKGYVDANKFTIQRIEGWK